MALHLFEVCLCLKEFYAMREHLGALDRKGLELRGNFQVKKKKIKRKRKGPKNHTFDHFAGLVRQCPRGLGISREQKGKNLYLLSETNFYVVLHQEFSFNLS